MPSDGCEPVSWSHHDKGQEGLVQLKLMAFRDIGDEAEDVLLGDILTVEIDR